MRTGCSLWLIFILPAAIVWWTAYRGRDQLPRVLVAAIVGWGLYVYHIDRVWDLKASLMQTDAEMDDWSSDTSRVVGKVLMGPLMLVYCCIHAAVARGMIDIQRRCLNRRSSQRLVGERR